MFFPEAAEPSPVLPGFGVSSGSCSVWRSTRVVEALARTQQSPGSAGRRIGTGGWLAIQQVEQVVLKGQD